jgi:DNA-binding IclR family transcriptional regulator
MKVKSALRVFEVLEYFDEIKRVASLSEISRLLGYPLSSTSGLLQSMVDVGYLTQTHKQYRPSFRVALLGSWVASDIAPEASVLKMMEWVGAQSSQTIVLAVPEPVQVRYIRVVPATSTMRMHVTPGALRPYPTSGLGRLFLSKMPDEKIVEIVHVYNKIPSQRRCPVEPRNHPQRNPFHTQGRRLCFHGSSQSGGRGLLPFICQAKPQNFLWRSASVAQVN